MGSEPKTIIAICTAAIVMMLVLLAVAKVSWDMGQEDIIATCSHASFFYKQGKTYECLPYKQEGVK